MCAPILLCFNDNMALRLLNFKCALTSIFYATYYLPPLILRLIVHHSSATSSAHVFYAISAIFPFYFMLIFILRDLDEKCCHGRCFTDARYIYCTSISMAYNRIIPKALLCLETHFFLLCQSRGKGFILRSHVLKLLRVDGEMAAFNGHILREISHRDTRMPHT